MMKQAIDLMKPTLLPTILRTFDVLVFFISLALRYCHSSKQCNKLMCFLTFVQVFVYYHFLLGRKNSEHKD